MEQSRDFPVLDRMTMPINKNYSVSHAISSYLPPVNSRLHRETPDVSRLRFAFCFSRDEPSLRRIIRQLDHCRRCQWTDHASSRSNSSREKSSRHSRYVYRKQLILYRVDGVSPKEGVRLLSECRRCDSLIFRMAEESQSYILWSTDIQVSERYELFITR